MSRTSFLGLFSVLWHPGTRGLRGTTRACLMLTLLLSGAIGSTQGQVAGCIAYTQNYPCVYLVNSGPSAGSVSVISSTTNTVIVPSVAAGSTPMGAAITPDNRSLYVVNNDDATVSIIDTTTNTATALVQLVSGGAVLGSPTQVAITPDGTAAYVVGLRPGFVAIIDTATQALTQTITGLSNPTAIAFSPDGKFAYISDYCPSTGTACVDVLDTSNNQINQTAGTPIPIWGSIHAQFSSIAVTSDGKLICVSVNIRDTELGIAFITTSNNNYAATLSLNVVSLSSDYGIAITPNGTLYAAEPGVSGNLLNSVAVVDINTRTLTNTIPVGSPNGVASSPTGVAATPDGAQVYVSNAGESSVSVIDTQTQTVTDTLTVQTNPAGVALMPTIVPAVQTQPASQTVSSGQTATLSIKASGTLPLSYQWYEVSGTVLTPIPGATGSSYTTSALTSTTSYAVVVSNVAASTQSNATVTVVPSSLPVISTQPVSQNINPGQTATLTVAATGSSPLSFQWYQGQSGVTTTPVGTNSNSFITPSLLATTAYWVQVTSSSMASVDSNTVIVAVNHAPMCSLSLQGAGSSQSLFNNNQFKVTGNANCNDPQGKLLTTTLDWGDGAPPSTQTGGSLVAPHVYASSLPNYPVTVTSSDSIGLQGSAFYTLIMIPTSEQPQAVFQGQSTDVIMSITGPTGLEVTFSCMTVTDSAGNVEQASALGIECSSDPPIITFTGAPQKVTIGIQTTGPALGRLFPTARPRSRLYASWFAAAWMVLPLSLVIPGAARRPRHIRRARIRLAALSIAIGLLASCGGGPKPRLATAAGSYQVTIVDKTVSPFQGFVQTSLIVPLTVASFQ